jgi:hypothetical protein
MSISIVQQIQKTILQWKDVEFLSAVVFQHHQKMSVVIQVGKIKQKIMLNLSEYDHFQIFNKRVCLL